MVKDLKAVDRKSKLVLLTIAKKVTELEADTEEKAVAWAEAFNFLIRSSAAETSERKAWLAKPDFVKELDTAREEHIKLTTEGDVFKKWPGRKNVAPNSATVRRLWIERKNKEEKICWGDVGTNKIKGYLPLEDVVQLFEEPDDPIDQLKFSIVCVGKALDLEARTTEIRNQWIRALRFFVAERKL